jgi:hypothetical protein
MLCVLATYETYQEPSWDYPEPAQLIFYEKGYFVYKKRLKQMTIYS